MKADCPPEPRGSSGPGPRGAGLPGVTLCHPFRRPPSSSEGWGRAEPRGISELQRRDSGSVRVTGAVAASRELCRWRRDPRRSALSSCIPAAGASSSHPVSSRKSAGNDAMVGAPAPRKPNANVPTGRGRRRYSTGLSGPREEGDVPEQTTVKEAPAGSKAPRALRMRRARRKSGRSPVPLGRSLG